MEMLDLKELCSNWDRSNEAFAEIVAATVKTLGLYQRELAAQFQVAESTVSRWSGGIARPHPRFQEMVVSAIQRRVSKALKSTNRASAPRTARSGLTTRHAVAAKSHS